MTLRFGRRFVPAPAFLLVIALVVMLMPGGPRVSRAAQEAPVQGDVTCDSSVNAVDSLQILRDVAGLGTTAGCLADAGDVNCDATVNSVDSLRILRYVAGLSVNAPDGCATIGEPLAPPPTSEALIAAALEAGDITYEESLLARAYALFDDPRLQDEFRSPIVDYHAAMQLFREVLENDGQLSPQLLGDLAPFMARPSDPISIFNNPPQGQNAAAAAVEWFDESAAGGKVRVWVKGDVSGGTEYLHEWSAEVTRIWNELPGIFRYGMEDTPTGVNGNPDNAIDIYFTNVGALDPRKIGCDATPPPAKCVYHNSGGAYTGYTAPFTERTSAGYIMIDRFITGPDLTDTIAHELVHTGQFAYDFWESFWLMDATAEWGGFRVTQKLNVGRQSSYQYLPTFFEELHKTLTRDPPDEEGKVPDLNRYGSWLFFYFASMELGDGIVTQIWEAAAAAGVQGEQAVDQKLPFNDYFDDFTVRNWNQKPPLKTAYKDKDDTFPSYVPKEDAKPIQAPSDTPIQVDLEALSAHYSTFTFDQSVHTVVFDNKLDGAEDVHVWGIVKVGDTWKQPEDWSNLPKKEWCRDDPEENLTELVVIVSNSHMTSRISAAEGAVVEAKTAGCSGWTGTATSTWWWDNFGYGTGIATATFEGSWKAVDDRGPLEIIECELYDIVLDGRGPCLPFYPTGNISWSWKSDIPGDPGCHESVTGQLAATVQPPPHSDLQIFVLQPDEQGQYRYWGNGYFEIPDWNQNPHCDNTINGGNRPYDFFALDEFASSENPTGSDGGTCYYQDWQISADATTIKGSCYDWNYSYHYLRHEWEFHYFGPH